jgi:predicted deacylase
VAALHGDEPCGVYTIEELLGADIEFDRPVRFIIANEQVFEVDERCLDDDLNRVFPGDEESNSHEKQLAAKLMPLLNDCEVLSLHSTDAEPTPFALIQGLPETTNAIIRGIGLQRVVDISYVNGGLESVIDGIAVECGPIGSVEATETAIKVVERFLRSRGALPGAGPKTDPKIYRVIDKVDGAFVFS